MISRFCQQIGLVYADQSTFHASPSRSPSLQQQDWRDHILKHLTTMVARHRQFAETQLEGEFDIDAGRFVLKLYVVTSLRLTRYRVKLMQDRKYKDVLMEEVEHWRDALRSLDLGTDVHIFRERLTEHDTPVFPVHACHTSEVNPVESASRHTEIASPILGTISGKLGNAELDLTGDLADRYEMRYYQDAQVRPRRKGRFIDLTMGEQVHRTVVRVAVKDLDKLSRLMLQHRGDEGSLVRLDLEIGVRKTNPKDRVGIVHQVHGVEEFRRELVALATRDVAHLNSPELEDALKWIPDMEMPSSHRLSQYSVLQIGQLKSSECANEAYGSRRTVS